MNSFVLIGQISNLRYKVLEMCYIKDFFITRSKSKYVIVYDENNLNEKKFLNNHEEVVAMDIRGHYIITSDIKSYIRCFNL